MFLSSSLGGDRVVEGPIPQHGEQDVAATSGESDQGLVVPLALADLALVVGAGDGVTQRSERREEPLVVAAQSIGRSVQRRKNGDAGVLSVRQLLCVPDLRRKARPARANHWGVH